MDHDAKNIMVILSSPSGAGKTTLVKKISANHKFITSISHTTRFPRPNEKDGKDYFFISKKKFKNLIKKRKFLEHAKVFRNYYGSSKDLVIDKLHKGRNVVFDIDWQGARQIRNKNLNYKLLSIFKLPPSKSELLKRLLKRGGVKGIKSSVGKVVKNTGKMLLKRFKLFYKAGPGRFIKKIPLVGSIIDFAINYFIFNEPLGNAVLKAAGAGIGAWAGGLAAAAAGSVIPFLGTAIGGTLGAIAGGMIGDALGGLLYELITSGGKGAKTETTTTKSKISIVNGQVVEDSSSVETTTEGAKEGAKVKKPQFVLVGEGGEDEWIVPKSRLGWWIAPLVGDIIEESVDNEKQENAKLKRETDKISEESVETIEKTDESKTWKPGKIFDPVIKLSKFFDKGSTDMSEAISMIKSQERNIEKLKPVKQKPNPTISTATQSPEPARATLNNIDPDPEPDYAEVIPGLLEASTTVISQESSQPIPLPVPVGVDSESSAAYAVWGRKVVGN